MAPDLLGAEHRSPSSAQLRSFALLSILYAAVTVAVIPWASAPGPADPNIVVVYGIGILVADLCTAALLGALYRDSGRSALLILTCAYLYGALMAAAHMVTFPGAWYEHSLFGGPQTVAWLFLAWRLGAALLFFAAVLQAARTVPPHGARLGLRLFAACLLTVAAAVVITSISARFKINGLSGDRFTEVATI